MKQEDQHVFQTLQNLQQLRCKTSEATQNKQNCGGNVFVYDFLLNTIDYSLHCTSQLFRAYKVPMRTYWI